MQDLVLKVTLQAVPTVWSLDTAPNALPRLHRSGYTFVWCCVLEDREVLIEESEKKKKKLKI